MDYHEILYRQLSPIYDKNRQCCTSNQLVNFKRYRSLKNGISHPHAYENVSSQIQKVNLNFTQDISIIRCALIGLT